MSNKTGKLFGLGAKTWAIIGGAAAVVAAVAIVLVLVLGGEKPVTDDTTTTEAPDNSIVSQLEAAGDATISLDEDLKLTAPVNVEGNKVLTGTGSLTGTAGMEYVISVGEGASLTLEGITIDGTDGATNGIYGGTGSTVVLASAKVTNFAGHGIRVLGKASVTGGEVSNAGTNWIMVDEGAELSITGGEFLSAGEIGIITGALTTLKISGAKLDGSKSYLVYNQGDAEIGAGTYTGAQSYVFYNAGTLSADKVDLTGAEILGYYENALGATLTLKGGNLTDSKADFVYNQGTFTAEGTTFDGCTNTAIESKGTKSTINLKNITAKNIGQHVMLLKNAVANVDGLTCEGIGSYICSNRSGNLTAKNIKSGNVGGAAFFNELLSDNDLPGNISVENFEIGDCGTYGVRTNIGNVVLKNGSFGKCASYGIYIKQGKVDMEGVNFAGTSVEGRAVVQIGYNTYKDAEVTMTGCTVTGGARGITNHANLVMTDCEIYGNTSAGEVHVGGGISNDGVMTIMGGSVHDNNAASSGGGIYNKGTMTIDGNIQVYGNTSATSGGGIANSGDGQMELKSATVFENHATNYGGGLYNSGTLTVSGGTFKNNKAEKGGGGAENTGKITLEGGTIKNNSSTSYGGGFYNGGAGEATLCGVTITDNKAGSDKSGGGVYNLGKLAIKKGTTITNNSAGTYGGGVVNSKSSDGTKIGSMTISGGNIKNNTAVKGAGGVYNTANMTISGGTIKENNIPDGANGKNVYSSGYLTVTGGTIDDTTGKPYDLYLYKGTLNYSGSAKVGSLYKGTQADVVLKGTVKNETNYYMGSYGVGDYAFKGDSKIIEANMSKFKFAEGTLTENEYVDNNGRLVVPGVDVDKVEVELWRAGKKVAEGLFSVVLSEFQSGDTIKIVNDVTIHNYAALTHFTGTEANLGKTKTFTITDDGKAHTVTFDTPSTAGFYIASSNGDGGNGKSESGYYRTYVAVDIIGTSQGGLTFKGAGESDSAGFYVSSNAILSISGKVTLENFTNISSGTASTSTHSTGKNGGAVYATAGATVVFDGTEFKNNKVSVGGGAGLYASGKATLTNCKFTGNAAETANGGGLYVTSTSVLKADGCTFAGNTAVNGGGAYVYQNTGSPAFTNCSFAANSASGDGFDLFLSADATVALKSVSMNSEATEGCCAFKTQAGDEVTIAGSMVIASTDLRVPFTVSEELSESSAIKVNLPAEDYVTGKVILSGAENAVSKAAEKIELTNTDPDKVLKVGADGKLYKVISANVVLLDGDGLTVATGTLKDILEQSIGENYTIKLIGNADVEEETDITGLFTIDGNGYKLLTDGNKLTLKGVTIKNIEIDEVTIDGAVTLEGKIILPNATENETGNFVFVSALDEKSSIGLTIADAAFSAGKPVITKAENAVSAEFITAIGYITIKNANPDSLVISKTTGALMVDEEPNATLTRGVNNPVDGLLVDFLADLQAGDIIALKKDISVSSILTVNADLTLKGEGHTLTLVNEAAGISIEGATLTLGSALKINAASGIVLTDSAISVDATGTLDASGAVLTMEGITSTSAGSAINNKGTMTLKDAVFTNISSNQNGGAVYNSGKATLSGGTFTNCDTTLSTVGGGGALYTGEGATTTLTGVTMTGCDSGYNGGTLYVNAGTLVLDGACDITGGTVPSGKNGTILYAGTYSDVTVKDGSYSGSFYLYAGNSADSSCKMTVTGGKFDCDFGIKRDSCVISIKGGYFTTDISKYVSNGYECKSDTTYPEYGYTVTEGKFVDYAAMIGTKGYENFEDAMDNIDIESDVTVKLLKDVTTVGEFVTTDANKTVITLDLNGHTITVTGSQFIKLKDEFVITDTSETGKGAIIGTATAGNNNGFIYQNIGKNVTVKAGTIKSATDKYVVAASGFKNGNIVIEGGVIENTGTGSALRTNNDGDTIFVKGGTVIGPITPSKGAVVVSGGTFSVDPSEYVDENHEAKLNQTTGMWEINEKAGVTYEAEVAGKKYLTFAEACAAAVSATETDGSSAVIKLLSDAVCPQIALRTSKQSTPKRTITLDLDGKSLSFTADNPFILNSGTTVEITGNGTFNAQKNYFNGNSGSKYVILSGIFTGGSEIKNSSTGTVVEIKGGSFNLDPTSFVDTNTYSVSENAGVYTVTAK